MENKDSVVIKGVRYHLTPRTLVVQEKMDSIKHQSELFEKGKISYREVLEEQIKFIEDTSSCKIFSAIPLESVDINDVGCAVIAILNAYNSRIMREKLKQFDVVKKSGKKNKK